MCTCMLIKNTHSYFGRNMDLNFSLNEKIIVIPRNYSINFKLYPSIMSHYAFFGFGCVVDNYPLLADGCNEHGLCIAVLNFPENAYYNKPLKNKNNITPFELPLLLLSKCKTIDDVKTTLKNINIVDISFSDSISLTDVHFMVSDTEKSIVIESTKQGLNVYQNPFNILTNNPPFLFHQENIKQYMNLSIEEPTNKFSKKLKIKPFGFGHGLIGLPGDYSSTSRFIRGLFVKENIVFTSNEISDVFYCLDSVKMIKGLVNTENGYEYTHYSCCVDMDECVYYYTKYGSNNIKKTKLKDYNLNNSALLIF